jgi:hypothetical protein
VRDHLDDLVAGHTVLERLPKMERKLVAPIESDEAGDGYEAAVARAKPLPPPHVVEQDGVADLREAQRLGAAISRFATAHSTL